MFRRALVCLEKENGKSGVMKKGRKLSSQRWLNRQMKDPWVKVSKQRGLRSRAALKLEELDAKHGIFHKGDSVLDVGAAPGGWTQVAVSAVGKQGKVLAVDLQPMEEIKGALVVQADVRKRKTIERIVDVMGDVDVVLSDLAPNATGSGDLDHVRQIGLVEMALMCAGQLMKNGSGVFVSKVTEGSDWDAFRNRLRTGFESVVVVKPKSSRQESREMYVVCKGIRNGRKGGVDGK